MSYLRETKEFQPITVRVAGFQVLDNVEVAMVRPGSRPTNWTQPVVLNGQLGIMITDFAVGDWNVFARVTSLPEIPVLYCGKFIVI